MNARLRIVSLGCCFVLRAAGLRTEPARSEDRPNSKPAAVIPLVVDADYKIGPQDVLRIDVWKEPDISRTIPVRPDGKVSLPLLNDVQAAGLTACNSGVAAREPLEISHQSAGDGNRYRNQQSPRLHHR